MASRKRDEARAQLAKLGPMSEAEVRAAQGKSRKALAKLLGEVTAELAALGYVNEAADAQFESVSAQSSARKDCDDSENTTKEEGSGNLATIALPSQASHPRLTHRRPALRVRVVGWPASRTPRRGPSCTRSTQTRCRSSRAWR